MKLRVPFAEGCPTSHFALKPNHEGMGSARMFHKVRCAGAIV